MSVLVDSAVWSLAFRRARPDAPAAAYLGQLLEDDDALLLGAVRQEVLSGIPDIKRFRTLRDTLRELPDYPITSAHYEVAAESFNLCRSNGIQGSNTDFLMCAVSILDRLPIYSTDKDFELFAKHIPVILHVP